MAGGAGSTLRLTNPAMSCFIACGGPSREWWAGLGTVTAALEGFGFAVFERKYEGGKCERTCTREERDEGVGVGERRE
jgi:hypothetical protein